MHDPPPHLPAVNQVPSHDSSNAEPLRCAEEPLKGSFASVPTTGAPAETPGHGGQHGIAKCHSDSLASQASPQPRLGDAPKCYSDSLASQQSPLETPATVRFDSSFSVLLRRLEEEHARELGELRAEIEVLKSRVPEKPPPPQAATEACEPPPLFDEGQPHEEQWGRNVSTQSKWAQPRQSTGPLLRVTVGKATGLPQSEWVPGCAPDAYVVCTVPGKPRLEFKTPIVCTSSAPCWNCEAVISGWIPGEDLEFMVMNRNSLTNSGVVGRASLKSALFEALTFEGELQLFDNEGSELRGLLQVKVEVALVRKIFSMHDKWKGSGESGPELEMDLFGQKSINRVLTLPDHSHHHHSSRWMLEPSSSFRLAWDLFGVSVLAADLVWIPMHAFNPPEYFLIILLKWCSAIYWTLDILMTFNTAVTTRTGQVIRSRREVCRYYVRKWLLPDLIVVFMEWAFFVLFDDLEGSVGGAARAGKVLRIARMFRLIRLMRLAKMRELVFSLQSSIESEVIILVVKVSLNMLSILALNHLLACGWFFVGTWSREGWVAQNNLDDSSFMSRYLISMQWSMAQFSPGASTVSPTTTYERMYSLGVLVLGFVVATCFVSNITSALSAAWAMKRNEHTQNVLLRRYLKQNKISRALGSRVTRYIHCVRMLRCKKVHASKVEYLDLLSGPLHLELLCELNEPRLFLHHLFPKYKLASKVSFQQICIAALEGSHFARHDKLFSRKGAAKYMYFLNMGTVVYRPAPTGNGENRIRHQHFKLECGNWFCENVLWVPWLHAGDMKALSDADVTLLNASKFHEVTMADPCAYQMTMEYARLYMMRLQQVGSFDPRAVNDLPFQMAFVSGEDKTGPEHFFKAGESPGRFVDYCSAALDLKEAEDVEAQLVQFSDSESEDKVSSSTFRSSMRTHQQLRDDEDRNSSRSLTKSGGVRSFSGILFRRARSLKGNNRWPRLRFNTSDSTSTWQRAAVGPLP